jgi:acetyl esterase/lipase
VIPVVRKCRTLRGVRPTVCDDAQNVRRLVSHPGLFEQAIATATENSAITCSRWCKLDADHIGIFGASTGGHLGLLLATTADNPRLEGGVGDNLNFSSRVQCVCAFYPPTDLNRLVSDPQTRMDANGDVARLIGGAVTQNMDNAVAASPLTYVDKNCAPVFLMHGGADRLVPPDQSTFFTTRC